MPRGKYPIEAIVNRNRIVDPWTRRNVIGEMQVQDHSIQVMLPGTITDCYFGQKGEHSRINTQGTFTLRPYAHALAKMMLRKDGQSLVIDSVELWELYGYMAETHQFYAIDDGTWSETYRIIPIRQCVHCNHPITDQLCSSVNARTGPFHPWCVEPFRAFEEGWRIILEAR